ncbi:MAG TPA: hypothetical protein VL614_00380 [Acetobacteraceae bacterium]|jgi:hypothetical protein|nr:hypothetical protein [Acetobacteraceae bacterium]
MTDILRIKRRTSGATGAPGSLANAELAYNEVDDVLYYGKGTGGAGGTATVVIPIGGPGMGSNANPVMNGVAAPGALASWARGDHVHPSDTSRAPLASPTFTGIPAAPTAAPGTNTTQLATTAYVQAATAAAGVQSFNTRTGTVTLLLTDVTGVGGAPLANPVFTGDPQAPTPATADNDTSVATTAFVKAQGYATVASVPVASSTNPLMNGVVAIGVGTTWARADHVHPVDTSRAPLASPVFTGNPTGPTPATGDNSVSLATTAFVKVQGYAPLASPVFTGNPTGPSPANTDNSVSLATTAYVRGLRQDQFLAPTSDVAWGSRKITALLDPTNPQDAATKNYVDGAIQGIAPKDSVRVATTANLAALSGALTIDGVLTVVGDRVLVKDQTAQANNGIYVVAAGAWARSADTNTWAELVSAFTFVSEGATNSNNGYTCTVNAGGTLGTTAVTWVQFSGAGQINAGNGMTKTGNTLDVGGTTARITVLADSIDIDAAYVGQTSITTLGVIAIGTWNGTTIAVNRGGTGATTLTGYLKGAGTSAFTGVATIPNTDITGLGTMSTQAATAVAITGGSIDGITFDMGSF